MDDGVVARLAEDRFHVTTTTVGAAHVIAQMEDFLQTEWPDLKVWFTSTTEQWATIAINGPRAREMLDAAWSRTSTFPPPRMPHMSMREGRICGVPTRLARVSFTGELGFEVNVPADYGRAVWEAIWAEGRKVRLRRLRPRRAADPARRKRLHRRRPGDRRHGDAGRSRPRQDDRAEQARFYRQTLARACPTSLARAASNWSG